MCWKVRIVVNLRKDTPRNRAAIELTGTDRFEVSGDFPEYELRKNGCACDLMGDPRGRITGLVPAVGHLLGQPVVKSVDIIWFWLGDEPKAPPREKMDMDEYRRRSEALELEQGTLYRVHGTFPDCSLRHGI